VEMMKQVAEKLEIENKGPAAVFKNLSKFKKSELRCIVEEIKKIMFLWGQVVIRVSAGRIRN
jgi:hypothetical protein